MIRLTYRATRLALVLLAVGSTLGRAEAQIIGDLGAHADEAGGCVENRAMPSPGLPPPRGAQIIGEVGRSREVHRVSSRETLGPSVQPVPPG